MLYIHALQDLNPKSADIECTELVREIKRSIKIPLTEQEVLARVELHFVSPTDIESMRTALEAIPQAVAQITALPAGAYAEYELVNLQRAVHALQDLPAGLQLSLAYAESLKKMQETFAAEVTPILNSLRTLKSNEELAQANIRVSAFFEQLLRTQDFAFRYQDIVYEMHLSRIKTLEEAMAEHIFFHVRLDEHLNKLTWQRISQRIPPEELTKVEAIDQLIKQIAQGVHRAYDINMRMIQMALILYAYIKIMRFG